MDEERLQETTKKDQEKIKWKKWFSRWQ
jgi:hypothetical protein